MTTSAQSEKRGVNNSAGNFAPKDLEHATKALHAAQFLISDLRSLVSSENLLLSDIAIRLLTDAAAMADRLDRVVVALTPDSVVPAAAPE